MYVKQKTCGTTKTTYINAPKLFKAWGKNNAVRNATADTLTCAALFAAVLEEYANTSGITTRNRDLTPQS